MTAECNFTFGQLLDHIKFGRNNEANSLLNEELVQKSDGLGTLLHRAAYYDNVDIIKRLIELGADVNFPGGGGKTPLMVAIQSERLASVKLLLAADVNIDIADADEQSPLQMVYRSDYVDVQIIEAILKKFQQVAIKNSVDDTYLFVNLCNLKCFIPLHAIILRDLRSIDWLMQFDSIYFREVRTIPLDRAMTFIFLELENNVESLMDVDRSALLRGCVFLTPEDYRDKEYRRELETYLVELGIMPTPRNFGYSIVHDLKNRSFREFLNNANATIAHLAVLEKLGTSIFKPAKCYSAGWRDGQLINVEKYHELCPPMLDTVMFGPSTLFDLLTDDHKLRKYVRNETFVSVIGNACSKHQLRELFPYYYKTLMNRILRVEQMMKLENLAIEVIFKIFKSNYNRCYHFARQVIGYFSKQELERLCLYGQIIGHFNEQELAELSLIYK